MILHNRILHWRELSYLGIFPLYLSMALILIDFLTAMRTAGICNYHSISLISWQKAKFTELSVQ